jgi:prepilin-type N-terminal cleavage/methylation domain-containing protein
MNQRKIFERSATHRGFTLVELLIVISIIALLAGLIFAGLAAVNKNKIKTRARAELAKLELAINAYQTKLGFYPPSDTNNPAVNSLYYELLGTTNDAVKFGTLDGGAVMQRSVVPAIFGVNVGGFMNSARRGGGDEAQTAIPFLKSLKPDQYLEVTVPNGTCFLLGAPIDGPLTFQNPVNGKKINPIRYNSLAPTNNPSSYDLWIDVQISGKTHRICNWSKEPLIVSP